jgi:LruC domain-containing protein
MMNNMLMRRLPQNTRFLLSFLLFVLAFQGCTNKNNVKPDDQGQMGGITKIIGSIAGACKQVCLVSGQHNYVGAVGVVTKNGDVLVTYKLTTPNVYLTEVHLDVFNSLAQLQADGKLSSTGVTAGKFAFSHTWTAADKTTTYTATIPKAYVDQLNSDCFFVAAQAVLSSGETAWGALCSDASTGVAQDATKQFAGNNGSGYFEFCKSDCAPGIVYTYAWEDLRTSGNDSDYNDMVVQSNVAKSPNELKINFLATARGASLDHKVRFRISKTGISGIFGATSYTQDANYYYVTVFESTKTSLPSLGKSVFANTEPGPPCVPFARREVVLTLNNAFSYNSGKPIEPYISVFTSGNATAGTGTSYDLYIYEVSNRDAWTATNGKMYPNGIIIPLDWRWPLEGVSITAPYPRYTRLSDGFTPNWASNPPVNPSVTFDKAVCQ